MIFVSIASYRDKELVPTILDLIKKADKPEKLRIFALNQSESEGADLIDDGFDELAEWADAGVVNIKYVHYLESKGAAWARHEIQKSYRNHKYVLQVDAHMRMAEGWDTICKEELDKAAELSGHSKVLITQYPAIYTPAKGDKPEMLSKDKIWCSMLDVFKPDGYIGTTPFSCDCPEDLVPNQTIQAGFVFSSGQLYKEVIIDPHMYFWGEEISFAVRAYTYGWDIYYSMKNISWHYYVNDPNTEDHKQKRKHGKDHTRDKVDEGKSAGTWYDHDQVAKARLRTLFQMSNEVDLGEYGLGEERTLAEYQAYAKLSFKRKAVYQHSLVFPYKVPQSKLQASKVQPTKTPYVNRPNLSRNYTRRKTHLIELTVDVREIRKLVPEGDYLKSYDLIPISEENSASEELSAKKITSEDIEFHEDVAIVRMKVISEDVPKKVLVKPNLMFSKPEKNILLQASKTTKDENCGCGG